jgi:hypothetical protein
MGSMATGSRAVLAAPTEHVPLLTRIALDAGSESSTSVYRRTLVDKNSRSFSSISTNLIPIP